MNIETFCGWRPIDTDWSSGLDFLGLAGPIEGILDAETSGITNATRHARYFSLVPWYYWKYATRSGKGSAKDQRSFAIGFEMLIAYANIAWREKTESRLTGIIREDYCLKRWKERKARLPLRGGDVGNTPSPLDAALYGPSLRRLNLLGRYGQLQTCRPAGVILAAEVDKSLGKLSVFDGLHEATTVQRSTAEELANHLSLLLPAKQECQLLRSVLFSHGQFGCESLPPRVYTLLLLLELAISADGPFTSDDIEGALAAGSDLRGKRFTAEPVLRESHTRWRILALLKFLRHACELAFGAIHSHVRDSGLRFGTAEAAAADLMARTMSAGSGATKLPSQYKKLVAKQANADFPLWDPPDTAPEGMLQHAITWCAWCHAIISEESGKALLGDDMVHVGRTADADLFGYSEHFERLLDCSMTAALTWLCVDRAIARHYQVASRKLAQHDTFRLIEDEDGIRATYKCPIPGIAIRVDSMLSLMADLDLLDRNDDGYIPTKETESWYKARVKDLS